MDDVMYWLWEMIKEVLSILFVLPFRIVWALYTMHISDSIPYIKQDFHYHLNRLKIHGVTFHLVIKNGKPSASVRSYFEETELLSEALNKKRYTNTRTLIEKALVTMKKCTYVVLGNNEKFIQFRGDGNTLFFDFPLNPLTLNRDYSSDVIHLLRQHGFSKYRRGGYAFKYKTYTIVPLKDEMTSISADFGNNLQLAVDVSDYIFTNIFRYTERPEVIFG